MDLKERLMKLNRIVDLKDYGIEYHGRYKQLHAHAIVKTIPSFMYGRHTKINGFRCQWQEITTNLPKVCEYIHKHNPDMEYVYQTEYTNYYHYHYGF